MGKVTLVPNLSCLFSAGTIRVMKKLMKLPGVLQTLVITKGFETQPFLGVL